MTRPTRLFAFTFIGCTAFFATSADAQNLSDRINHVMQQRTAAEAKNTSKAAMLGTLLYTDISVQFQQTPLRDAINYLETVLGINIVGRYNDDKTGIGLDPEAPITLDVKDQPALSVLEMVLSQAEDDSAATWQLRDGYVEVGTKERLGAGSAREIRYYPIKDLLMEVPMFDNAPALDLDAALSQSEGQGGGGGGGGGGGFGGGGGGGGGGSGGSLFTGGGTDPERQTETERAEMIIDLIVETVEPDAWELAGGDQATIRYYAGTLIVRAPDYIHRQIAGYPFAARPVGQPRAAAGGSRYVTFTGALSNVQLTGIRTSPQITGAAGGGGSGAGSTEALPVESSSKGSAQDSSANGVDQKKDQKKDGSPQQP